MLKSFVTAAAILAGMATQPALACSLSDISFSGVSYRVEGEYTKYVVVVGTVTSHCNQPIVLLTQYGGLARDKTTVIDLYEFPLELPANGTQHFRRRGLDYITGMELFFIQAVQIM